MMEQDETVLVGLNGITDNCSSTSFYAVSICTWSVFSRRATDTGGGSQINGSLRLYGQIVDGLSGQYGL
ncbi:MAG: hypothetical protein EZS28_023328, partial [Streblomastix strix]